MDKEMLETYASRESLTVEALPYILFKKQAGQLKQECSLYYFYSTMRTPQSKKTVPLYENFSKWAIALIHPRPNFGAELSDITGTQVRLQDFYSWYSKNKSRFTFSTEAKHFLNFLRQKKEG